MSSALKLIETRRKALLRDALEQLDEIEKLAKAARRCIEDGGVPIYLWDLRTHASAVVTTGALMNQFHILSLDMKRKPKKQPRERNRP